MIKKAKQSFGVFEDGPVVTFVNLMRDGDDIFIQALDRNELVVPLYRRAADDTVVKLEEEKWDTEHFSHEEEEVKIDEFTDDSEISFQLQPFDRILAGFDLKHGVLALNVNDENLQIFTDAPTSSVSINKFIKNNLEKDVYKARDWRYARLKQKAQDQLWLHSGTNQLLELVFDFQRNNKVIPFYQLADANDIALTDFFKCEMKDKEKRALLVYVGHDYRKAFLFEEGEWVMTLPLQITQKVPEPDILYSKLSLALDNAQVPDPDEIYISGDQINSDAIAFLKKQFPAALVDFMHFHLLSNQHDASKQYEARYLIQFALPIALAYKALFPDDPRFTNSNFLPSRIIEGQKVFKIAWHGFIILGSIFLFSTYATWALLSANLEHREENSKFKNLNADLNRKRIAAGEIKKIRDDISRQEENIEVMLGLLQDKNPGPIP